MKKIFNFWSGVLIFISIILNCQAVGMEKSLEDEIKKLMTDQDILRNKLDLQKSLPEDKQLPQDELMRMQKEIDSLENIIRTKTGEFEQQEETRIKTEKEFEKEKELTEEEKERLLHEETEKEIKEREKEEQLEKEKQKEKEKKPKKKEKSKELAKRGSLTPLTDEQMQAGLGTNFYESVKSNEWHDLHNAGNLLPNNFLLDIFHRTAFRYYTYKLLEYDLTADYKQGGKEYKNLTRENIDFIFKLLIPLAKRLSTRAKTLYQDNGYLLQTAIPHAIEFLKHNQSLNNLIVAYMRQKIVVEKLTDLASANKLKQEIREQINNNLYHNHDPYATELQTMIYYFIKEAYEEYVKELEKYLGSQSSGREDINGKFLETFKPTFFDEDYYKNILAKLPKLMKPMTENEMISESEELKL